MTKPASMYAVLLLLCVLPLKGYSQLVNWELLTDTPGWESRDSAGEMVFNDHMWVMGGWFNSFDAPPRDVWKSSDGIEWTQVRRLAPWMHSDFPMTVVFNNRMWIMGGWFNGRLPGHSAGRSVWSSTNGNHWKKNNPKARWSGRLAGATVAFKGKMWVIGGTENYYFGDQTSLKNDVWSSVDGTVWKCELKRAPWVPRAYHRVVVFDNKMWLMGGGNYLPEYEAHQDVWSSSDGVVWHLETASAPWHPRIWFSSVVYRDRIWVLGGWSNDPARNWADVWYSRDGINWNHLETPTTWSPRHAHSIMVFNNKLMVAGGHAAPLNSEVWCLDIPEGWLESGTCADSWKNNPLLETTGHASQSTVAVNGCE